MRIGLIDVERYDIPASDAGYERIKCKDCRYNDKYCDCNDCYLMDGKECPRTEATNENNT